MKIYRTDEGKMVSGVCGGIAEYFEIDPSIVRILFVLAAFADGIFVFLYIVATIILPVKDSTYDIYDEENKADKNENKVLGIILIAAGLIFLLKQFIPLLDLNYLLPVALIITGVAIIAKRGGN